MMLSRSTLVCLLALQTQSLAMFDAKRAGPVTVAILPVYDYYTSML
jgi:hypothetical protein